MPRLMWTKRYPVDSLQIYFAASLELQEELINHGFYIPRSPDRKVIMPIPLIYSNFRGWIKPVEPITIERLIPPQWIGLTPENLGWIETRRNGRKAYILPREDVYVNVGVYDNNSIVFDLDIKGYHLERTSIRGTNPDKWTNWAMFYISLDYIDELIDAIGKYVSMNTQSHYGPLIPGNIHKSKPIRETKQRGKEVTYYVKVPVRDFSFCLGCFELARRYLNIKAKEHCIIDPNLEPCKNQEFIIGKLKLRLRYNPKINTFAKVGIAKISGKRPQIMIKLASAGPTKIIHGILKDRIEGKARGSLVYCNHTSKRQYIILDLREFYKALITVKSYIGKLPSE